MMVNIKEILAPFRNSFLTGLTYPGRWIRATGNNISDAILSEVWATGVTIGLVTGTAVQLKRAIIGSKKRPERSQSRFIGTPTEKPEPPMVVEPGVRENKALLGLSEDAKSFEEDLTEVEKTIAEMERQMKRR